MNFALLAGLHLLRNAPTVLDGALAARLGMPVEQLREAVAQDPACFSEELVFRLTEDERKQLSSDAMLAFTESGAALLALKLPHAPVLDTLKDLAATRGAWMDQAQLNLRVTALELELKGVMDSIQAAREEKPSEHPIGFDLGDLPTGVKAKERADKDKL